MVFGMLVWFGDMYSPRFGRKSLEKKNNEKKKKLTGLPLPPGVIFSPGFVVPVGKPEKKKKGVPNQDYKRLSSSVYI